MTVNSEWSDQPVLSPLVVVESGVPSSGLFVYSGTPGPGNPPVASIVAPGVTTDPYGNTVASILEVQESGLQTVLTAASLTMAKNSGALAPPDIILGDNTAPAGTPSQTFIRSTEIITPVVIAVQPGTSSTAETWHAATLGTGWTGSVRYKMAADINRVFLEVNATFTDNGTTHLASGTDILGVALPAGYQPANASPEMAAGITGTGFTITASRVPCVHVGTGGAVFADFVTTTASTQTATFSGEFSYPLD